MRISEADEDGDGGARAQSQHPAYFRAPGASRPLPAAIASDATVEEVEVHCPTLSLQYEVLLKIKPSGVDIGALSLRSANPVCTSPVLSGIYVPPEVPPAPHVPAILAIIGAASVDLLVRLRGGGGLVVSEGEVETFLDTQASPDEEYYYSFFPRCHMRHGGGSGSGSSASSRPRVRTSFAADPNGRADTVVQLRALVPGSTYCSRCRVRNAIGWGPWSALSPLFSTNDGFRALIATGRKFEHFPDLPMHVHMGGRKVNNSFICFCCLTEYFTNLMILLMIITARDATGKCIRMPISPYSRGARGGCDATRV